METTLFLTPSPNTTGDGGAWDGIAEAFTTRYFDFTARVSIVGGESRNNDVMRAKPDLRFLYKWIDDCRRLVVVAVFKLAPPDAFYCGHRLSSLRQSFYLLSEDDWNEPLDRRPEVVKRQ